ncbi:hypothetical protein PAHAL_8G266300 [Panicum hallii]|uniref:Uncharacterized protein n=1 Tax=Panicum hallii TaxID=206008 RepID=A0A2T8IAD9_9POAL|nr:hypothetical protein PAHAL_8G266300 [Panicum hallii]
MAFRPHAAVATRRGAERGRGGAHRGVRTWIQGRGRTRQRRLTRRRGVAVRRAARRAARRVEHARGVHGRAQRRAWAQGGRARGMRAHRGGKRQPWFGSWGRAALRSRQEGRREKKKKGGKEEGKERKEEKEKEKRKKN